MLEELQGSGWLEQREPEGGRWMEMLGRWGEVGVYILIVKTG